MMALLTRSTLLVAAWWCVEPKTSAACRPVQKALAAPMRPSCAPPSAVSDSRRWRSGPAARAHSGGRCAHLQKVVAGEGDRQLEQVQADTPAASLGDR